MRFLQSEKKVGSLLIVIFNYLILKIFTEHLDIVPAIREVIPMGVKKTTHPNLNKNKTSKCNNFQKEISRITWWKLMVENFLYISQRPYFVSDILADTQDVGRHSHGKNR